MSGGSQFAPGQATQGNFRQVNSSNFWDHLSYLRGGSPGDAAIVNMLIQPVPPAETQSQHHSSELESRSQGQSQQLSSNRYDAGSYNTPERPSSKYNNYYGPDFPAQTINGLTNQSQSSNNTIPTPNTNTSSYYNYHNSLPPVREITCPSCGHNLGSIDSISKPGPVPVPVTIGNHYNNSAPHESSQGQKSGEWKWVSEPSVISSSWSTAPPPPPPPQENQFQNTSFNSSPSKPPRLNPKDEEPPKNPFPYRNNFNPTSNNPQLNHQLNQNNKQDKRAVIRNGPGTRVMSGGKSQANESHSEKNAGCDDYESQYTSYKPNTAHRTLSELLRLENREENRYPSSNTNRSLNNTPRPQPRPRPKSNQRENLFLNDWNLGPGRRQIGQSHATNRSTGQQRPSPSGSYRYGCENNHDFDGNHLAPTTDGNPPIFSQSDRPIQRQRPWEAQPMSIPPVCQAGREEIDGNGHEPVIQNSRTYLWDQHVVQNMKECWERFLQLRASEDDDAPENSNFQSHQRQRQRQQQQSPQKYLSAKSKSNDYNFWELEPEPEPEVRRHGKSVEARSRATWTCHCACRIRDEDRETVQNNNEVEFNSFQDFPSHSHDQSGPSHQFQTLKKGPCSAPPPARSGKTGTGSGSVHSSAQVKRSFLDIRSEFQAAAAEFIRRQEERQQIHDNDEGRIRIEHEKDNLSKASEISSEEKVEMWMERNSSLGSSCDNNSSGKRHGKGRGTSTTEQQPQHQYYTPKPKSGNAVMSNVDDTDTTTRVEILERATSDSCGSEDMEDVQVKPNQYFSKSSSSPRDGHQVEMGTADNCVKAGISISTSTEVDGFEEAEIPSSRGTVERRSSTDTTFLSITDDDDGDGLRKSSTSSSETSSATSNASSSSQGPPIPPLDDDRLGATSESWGWSSWFSSS